MREILSFVILFTFPIAMVLAFLFFIAYVAVKEKQKKIFSIVMHLILFIMMLEGLAIMVYGFDQAVKGGQ